MNRLQQDIGNEEKIKLENLVKESKKDKLIGYAKIAGNTILLLTVFGIGLYAPQHVFENKDLAYVSLSVGFISGGIFGTYYTDTMKENIKDIKSACKRIKYYKTKLIDV